LIKGALNQSTVGTLAERTTRLLKLVKLPHLQPATAVHVLQAFNKTCFFRASRVLNRGAFLRNPAPTRTTVAHSYFPASTLTLALGVSPNISGAYIASTRLGGSENSPTLLSRIVYSILVTPLGRNW
jgi:hypothetical protein